MWHNVKAYNLIYLKLIYCDGRNNLRPDRDLNPDPLNLDMLYQQSLISGAGIPNLIKISRSDSYLFWEQ